MRTLWLLWVFWLQISNWHNFFLLFWSSKLIESCCVTWPAREDIPFQSTPAKTISPPTSFSSRREKPPSIVSDSVDMNEAVGGQECLQSILVYYHPVRSLKSHSDFFTQWRNEFKSSKVKRWFDARIQG